MVQTVVVLLALARAADGRDVGLERRLYERPPHFDPLVRQRRGVGCQLRDRTH